MIHLLHLVEPPPRMTAAYATSFDPVKFAKVLTAEANASLDRFVGDVKDRNIPSRAEVCIGVDFREIIDYARTHAIMGSTAEQVVRRGPCPVLTLRAVP